MDQYSVFAILLLAISAYLFPVKKQLSIPWRKIAFPALELYLVSVIAFFITKSILYTLFSAMSFFGLHPVVMVAMLALLLYLTGSSFFYLTRNQLYGVKAAFIPLMISVELLIAALSWLCGWLITPGGQAIDVLIIAVQYGFPFFWAPLLLGLFSIFSLQHLSNNTIPTRRKEILDDVEFPDS